MSLNDSQSASRSVADVSDNDAAMLHIPPPPAATNVPKNPALLIKKYLSKDDVLKSEIIWTLKLVTGHQSYKSSEGISDLFQAMFPDSEIAKQFTCGEKKSAYLSVFGIGEHFMQLLKKSVSVSGLYVVLFDESLNSKMQEKQMDIHLRFWNTETNKVDTRYFTSQFLGHATADDMISHFTHSVLESGLYVPNMVQVSMDGPNVNWKFLKLLQEKLSQEHNSKLINIGSCGLHIVHNSFKSGAEATGWNIASFLSGLYYLFKDSPARREDFTKVTGCSMLPLKFVSHRWLENVPVCERAILLWDKIVIYVKAVESKKLSKPTCKSYQTVLESVQDTCFVAKLTFFKTIALQLQPFLSQYQSNKPMVGFLCEDLVMLIRSLMRRFIKSEELEQLNDETLAKLDVTNKDFHVTYSKVEVGFSSEKALKQKSSYTGKQASEKQVLDFRMNCKNFLISLLKKMLLKCPVSYSLVRYLACFSPVRMVSAKEECIQKFKKVLNVLLNAKRVEEMDCDVFLDQYLQFLESIPMFGSEKFSNFDKSTDSADQFFHHYMCQDGRKQQFEKLFSVVKYIMILSHGQAAVERGFSVNKEIEVENMKKQTLVAHRAICDHVTKVGGILKVDINKELLLSAKFSRQRYDKYLEVEREKKKSAEEKKKRKCTQQAIEEIKKKKRRLELDITSLSKTADDLSLKAEATQKMSFVVQSNALRKSVKDKTVEIGQLEESLNERLENLKKR